MYYGNIEQESIDNSNFRKVVFTGERSQLVVMSLLPGEEIGEEIHETIDQFIRVESGTGKAVVDGNEYELKDGFAVVVPAGVSHNVVNGSTNEPLKLYTIYSPAEHKPETVHRTKAEALADHHDH